MNLALFDFDGTITVKDSFFCFMDFVSRKHRIIGIKRILFLPIGVLYFMGLLPMGKAKEMFLTFCFKGWKKSYFDQLAKVYADTIVPQLIRPNAMEQVKKHKSTGDKIAIVTASLDSWLMDWCREYELDLICSSLEVTDGLITGKLTREDCTGIEKVKRIQEKYDLDDYHTVFAYGDSPGDIEMLALADTAYYRWEKQEK